MRRTPVWPSGAKTSVAVVASEPTRPAPGGLPNALTTMSGLIAATRPSACRRWSSGAGSRAANP
jgi:hypothetical protein